MKKVRLMKLALIGLLMGMTQSAHAFDWSDSSYGNAPATVAYTGTDDDQHQVFFYNVAQKKFLAFGGFWGTEAVLSDVGSTAYLKKKSSGSYGIVFSTSHDAALGYIYSRSVSTQNGVFSDAVQNSSDATVNHGFWKITHVGNNEYTISVSDVKGTYYLCYSKTDKRSDIVSCTTTNGGDNCKWKLITKANMKDQFEKVANVDYDNPIDATFYIRNYGFTRAAFEAKNLSWSVSPGSWSTVNTAAATTTTTNYLSVTAMPFYYGNSLVQSYSTSGTPGSSNFSVSNYVALDYDKNIKQADGTTLGLSGANGEFYVIQNADLAYLPSDYTANGSNNTYYNLIYGAYFNAKITGDGTVSQTFTVDKAGWYEVSCQGFNTAGNTNATVFAKVTGATETRSDMSNTIQGLPEGVTYNMTSAGIAFAQKMYDNVVLFYVPEDHKEVTIGVKVTDAKEGEYTEFDDFRLVYRGLPEYPILLDEDKVNTDYIVFPEAEKTATVVLKRTFSTATTGSLLWNSIVLPFNLTGAQVKNYFGQNVKLAELAELTSSKIWYKSVDLSTDGMKAGTPYIIKCDPTLAQYTKGAITVASKNVNTAVETLDADAEYIVIPQVALKKGEDGKLPLSTDIAANDNAEIKACGLYVKQEIPLVAGHHYYAYAKGILYHYSKELPANKRETLPMKGFRVYFDWTETTASGAKLSCYLDGVEEQTIITAIEGVTTGEALTPANGRKGIFTLDGQQVRGTGDSVEGLHKGVYIVNGKKLVVK